MNKAVLFAAALLAMPLPAMGQQQPQQSQDQSQDRGSGYSERDRDMDRTNERVEGACGNDIERFCSEVSPGGGRMASCMEAYSDQLSRSCQFALRRATNR